LPPKPKPAPKPRPAGTAAGKVAGAEGKAPAAGATKVKRPLNAFMLFSTANRSIVKGVGSLLQYVGAALSLYC
jgi:hypothetical protein